MPSVNRNRSSQVDLLALTHPNRRDFLLGAATVGASTNWLQAAWAQSASVRIAIAYPDVPRLWGGPDMRRHPIDRGRSG